ncbi:MAG TPA: glycosyltransferase [Usitatibacter sp.]|nr:glycosyltransferase [Usitatibacter sp.]
MAAPALSATIVTYRTPGRVLEDALRSLAAAVDGARAAGLLGEVALHVVDNSPADAKGEAAGALAAWPAQAGSIELLAGHGNLGYGRANNLVLPRLRSELHLVMNPDVELDADALRAALQALADHPEFGLVAPSVRGEDGAPQYLCKRYPSVWVLFLRGFAPPALRRRFSHAIEYYEMRDVIGDRVVPGVPLASGCFMLARTALFVKLGGFDPRFFMYFEDYDLSMRIGREASVAYVPQVRIVHHGGEAARKGWRHVAWFVSSAWRFFARHGWKLA